jgi:hypothetical protein
MKKRKANKRKNATSGQKRDLLKKMRRLDKKLVELENMIEELKRKAGEKKDEQAAPGIARNQSRTSRH